MASTHLTINNFLLRGFPSKPLAVVCPNVFFLNFESISWKCATNDCFASYLDVLRGRLVKKNVMLSIINYFLLLAWAPQKLFQRGKTTNAFKMSNIFRRAARKRKFSRVSRRFRPSLRVWIVSAEGASKNFTVFRRSTVYGVIFSKFQGESVPLPLPAGATGCWLEFQFSNFPRYFWPITSTLAKY